MTPRTYGHSLITLIEALNRTIQGWYEYFKHCYKTVFNGLDGTIRRRLRAILRKRKKISGSPNGYDNMRWPNAYFANHGLFFMAEAHRLELESLRKGNH